MDNSQAIGRPLRARLGVMCALAAFGTWAMYPLLWAALARCGVGALEIFCHRIVWSALFAALLLGLLPKQSRLPHPHVGRFAWPWYSLASSTIILINWLVTIWGAQHGALLHCSLGYFLAPLAHVLLGVILFGERLSLLHGIALALAAFGVAAAYEPGEVSTWLPLLIAMTSAGYTAARKLTPLSPLRGLFWETAPLAPCCLLYLWLERAQSHVGILHMEATALLMLAGLLTCATLLSFVQAARTIPLTTLGFLQYIHPSGQLLLALTVFGEPMTTRRTVTLACILSALILAMVAKYQQRLSRIQLPTT